MSIIEAVKRNQLDVYGYLLHLLPVLPEWGENPVDAQIESVMPWSLALPPFCKQTYSQVQLALQHDIKLGTIDVTH